jgi:hypothetical protein
MARKLEVLAESGWGDIEEMAQKAIDENWFPEAAEKGTMAYVKARLRMMANKKAKETGLPLMGSITVLDKNKKPKKLYKQPALFDVQDYREACDFHRKRSKHHDKVAKAYAEDCYKRYGVQLHLDLNIAI